MTQLIGKPSFIPKVDREDIDGEGSASIIGFVCEKEQIPWKQQIIIQKIRLETPLMNRVIPLLLLTNSSCDATWVDGKKKKVEGQNQLKIAF